MGFWSDLLKVLLGGSPVGTPPAPVPTPPPATSPNPQPSAIIQALLDAHNAERYRTGAKALQLQKQLISAAQGHATWMAANRIMRHQPGANGSTMGQRVSNEGYVYVALGENIAAGYRDVSSVMNGWMNSSGHRQNILNPNYREVGFGAVSDSKGNVYWCTVFGTPSKSGVQSMQALDASLPDKLLIGQHWQGDFPFDWFEPAEDDS